MPPARPARTSREKTIASPHDLGRPPEIRVEKGHREDTVPVGVLTPLDRSVSVGADERRVRSTSSGLHAQLLEIQVALDATPHLVVELAALAQPEHCSAFGVDHGPTYQTMLEQLLLGVRVELDDRPILGRMGRAKMAGAVDVLRSQRVDQ